MKHAQVPRQSPRLSPRAVSTGSCCRRLLASGILLRRKQEVRAVTWADQRPAVSVSLAGASRGPAGAGNRCSPTLPTSGVPFPLHNQVLSLGKICKPLLPSDALRPNCTAGFVLEEKFEIDGFSSFMIFFPCHPEVGEDRVFKN